MNRIIEEGTVAAARGTALALAVGSGLLSEAAALIAGQAAQHERLTAGTFRGRDPWAWLRVRPERPAEDLPAGPVDAAELEQFIDRFFAAEGVGTEIPCAAFVMVKDGRVFFQKGYGYADSKRSRPVTPRETPFCVASNTGSLAATAMEMGRFLLYVLSSLAGGAHRPAETTRMYRQHFARYPGSRDAVYGFLEGMANCRRTLFHTGDGRDPSLLYLMPDQQMAFYAVVGGTDGKRAFRFRTRLVQKLLDRYYPAGDEANGPGSNRAGESDSERSASGERPQRSLCRHF